MLGFVHFEISADDPERAIKFYTDVFGWKTEKWEGPMDYWLVTTGPDDQPGINSGIAKRQDPSERVTNTIDVPSVDEFIKKITQAGGKVTTPKTPIESVGYFALCLDTEGNPFGIMEADPQPFDFDPSRRSS
jgi:predicted enzyme related to lactoylglutathione lyase